MSSPSPLPVKVLAAFVAVKEGFDVEQFVSQLMVLAAINSASDNPGGLNQVAEMLSNLMNSGLTPTIVPHAKGNAVVGVAKGDNPDAPPILLLGHHDTVYSEGVPAPSLTRDGAKLWGPGVEDMKGGCYSV